MLPVALLVPGAAKVVSVAVISGISVLALRKLPKFWRKIVNLAKKLSKGIKVGGIACFVKKEKDRVCEILKKYFKEGDNWFTQEPVIREISNNEVPEDILKKAAMQEGKEVDCTKELDEQLLLLS